MLLLAAVRDELGDLPGEAVGVGPVVAAVGAAVLLARHRPDAAVLIGSAGRYAGGPAVGTAIAARRLGYASGTAILARGYVPRPPSDLQGDAALRRRLDLPEADVLTTDAITTDESLAASYATQWSVEHLEAWGVAWACVAAGVPFVAVLGIANDVGPDAHAQWSAHRGKAESAARRAVEGLLR